MRRRGTQRATFAHAALRLATLAAACSFTACQLRTGGYAPPEPPPRRASDAAARRDSVPTVSHAAAIDAPHYVARDLRIVLPPVQREFRGVWVATVGNMDWPSRRDLSTAEQQAELIRILDAARDYGLNAVIFQVRTMADAFYPSSFEPWSDFLTGVSGQAPDPYWDPLQFAIDQAHARGLELHAWFNPFRAGFVAKRTPLAADHITRRRPDLVRRYGTHYWLDPGEPDARRLAIDVITDVVRRYDVDAIQIDDYFYPYRERDARGRLIPFPDDATWREYGIASGLDRDDWRRSNTDTFVRELYRAVHAEKRYVAVGISPFGIWRPGYPASVRGLDTYHELYADTRKWLANGWADYFAPQLYWRTHAPQQDYASLLQWWAAQNEQGRHIWPGNIPNRVGDGKNEWPASEIIEQVRLTRSIDGASGNIHFSAGSLLRDARGVTTALHDEVYLQPALVPGNPWLTDAPPPPPHAAAAPDPGLQATSISFEPGNVASSRWIVRARWADDWETLLLPGAIRRTHVGWRAGVPPDLVAVTAVGPAGVEGAATVLVLETR